MPSGSCGLEVHVTGKGSAEKVHQLLVMLLLLTIHGQELIVWPRKGRNVKGAHEIVDSHILFCHKKIEVAYGVKVNILVCF